jgi:uncharacterized protein YhaN
MKTPRVSKKLEMARAVAYEELEQERDRIEQERERLRQDNAALLAQRDVDESEAFESAVYNSKLQDEIRQLKSRNERLYQIMDGQSELLRARTTALCALLGLSDPGKSPPPYEEKE